MKETYVVVITYANGSVDRKPFPHYHQAHYFCRHGISYTGDRVRRVEVEAAIEGSTRAIWDASWTDESKAAGLRGTL